MRRKSQQRTHWKIRRPVPENNCALRRHTIYVPLYLFNITYIRICVLSTAAIIFHAYIRKAHRYRFNITYVFKLIWFCRYRFNLSLIFVVIFKNTRSWNWYMKCDMETLQTSKYKTLQLKVYCTKIFIQRKLRLRKINLRISVRQLQIFKLYSQQERKPHCFVYN
jgi:hypothetical protein